MEKVFYWNINLMNLFIIMMTDYVKKSAEDQRVFDIVGIVCFH